MNKTIALGALATVASIVAAATPASAATTITITDPEYVTGSAAIPLTTVTGAFDYIIRFKIPSVPGMVAAASITSDSGNTILSSGTLNTIPLTLASYSLGYTLTGTAPRNSMVYQYLEIMGTTASDGNGGFLTGAFGGTVSFMPQAAAVPEAATWAMMIAGFGLVGGALRSRKNKVSFA